MNGMMAVVTCFAGDFAPKTWAFCSGQILAIAQNQALFSLLGTTYGGNGVTTFALPDLRGRTAVGIGQGIGTANYFLGQQAGSETVTLTTSSMPAHVHTGTANLKLEADSTACADPAPDFNYPGPYTNAYAAAPTNGANMLAPKYLSVTIGSTGNGQPVPVLSPYLAINYIICLQGVYPSRN
jgi:microcystin-dependent protein